MGLIFKNTPLKTKDHLVGGETLTFYEWPASVYFQYLLDEETARGYMGADSEAGESGMSALESIRDGNEHNYKMCAASLLPGIAADDLQGVSMDAVFETVLSELKLSLNSVELVECVSVVRELNQGPDPKDEAQADDSSTG